MSGINPSTPYGDAATDPVAISHRRPVRVTVVAVLCFVFAGVNTLACLAATIGGPTASLGTVLPDKFEYLGFLFGGGVPYFAWILFYLVYSGVLLVAGICLFKRNVWGMWLLLASDAIVFFDRTISQPRMLKQLEEAVTLILRRDYPTADIKKTVGNAVESQATMLQWNLIINLGIAVFCAVLLLSVHHWFRGEAVCKERAVRPAALTSSPTS